MRKPLQFKEWWMRMWPNYFHLPKREFDAESGLIRADDHAPAERLVLGQRVRALMKIKWAGGGEKYRTTFIIHGKKHKAYIDQILETSSDDIASGSKYKIYAGNEGSIA